MIRSLIARDLRLIARERGFRVVLLCYLCAYLAASAAFCMDVLRASDPESARRMVVLFPKLAVLQTAFLALITPWAVLRLGKAASGDNLVRMAAEIFASPWQIMLTRLIATVVYLAELLILSWPVLCVARLLGAADFGRMAWSLADTFLFLMLLVALVLHFSMRGGCWALSWILSYTAISILGYGWYRMSFAIDPVSGTMALFSLAMLLVFLLFTRANRSLAYLKH
jgi:hypothetical protein